MFLEGLDSGLWWEDEALLWYLDESDTLRLHVPI